MPSKKFLDQKLVTEFVEWRGLKRKIEKWLKVQRDEFLEQLDSGWICPGKGPYLLVPESGSRSAIDWKQEFFNELKQKFVDAGSTVDVAEQLAVARMAALEIAAGRKEYIELADKPNPAFNGKVLAAVVRKIDARAARGF